MVGEHSKFVTYVTRGFFCFSEFRKNTLLNSDFWGWDVPTLWVVNLWVGTLWVGTSQFGQRQNPESCDQTRVAKSHRHRVTKQCLATQHKGTAFRFSAQQRRERLTWDSLVFQEANRLHKHPRRQVPQQMIGPKASGKDLFHGVRSRRAQICTWAWLLCEMIAQAGRGKVLKLAMSAQSDPWLWPARTKSSDVQEIVKNLNRTIVH